MALLGHNAARGIFSTLIVHENRRREAMTATTMSTNVMRTSFQVSGRRKERRGAGAVTVHAGDIISAFHIFPVPKLLCYIVLARSCIMEWMEGWEDGSDVCADPCYGWKKEREGVTALTDVMYLRVGAFASFRMG